MNIQQINDNVQNSFYRWLDEFKKDLPLNPKLLGDLEKEFLNFCEVYFHYVKHIHNLKTRFDNLKSE